jgi:hypothetical protein
MYKKERRGERGKPDLMETGVKQGGRERRKRGERRAIKENGERARELDEEEREWRESEREERQERDRSASPPALSPKEAAHRRPWCVCVCVSECVCVCVCACACVRTPDNTKRCDTAPSCTTQSSPARAPA